MRALALFLLLCSACKKKDEDSGGGPLGPCDDGIFCNGTERLTEDGTCVPGYDPCDDYADCTTDSCDEGTGTCSHVAEVGCDVCMAADCTPDCGARVCGDDGCGGSCGACGTGDACAADGTCAADDGVGTCAAPIPLPIAADTEQTIAGDTSAAVHQLVPTCNSTSTAVELVYALTVTERVGLDIRSSGYDTVLFLRSDCDDESPAATLDCSDDASPPGDYGSRLAVAVDPGTYYLVVDGFDSTQYGPFDLYVRAVSNGCVPACDGLYCGGDDGCGGDCGGCDVGEACTPDTHVCQPDPCVPDCDGKECGSDGCGGECGSCTGSDLCVLETNTCESFAACDHDAPTCTGCRGDQFCGSDCECHDTDELLPDLVVNTARLASEILFESQDFTAASCAVVEGCVGDIGTRDLLRFSVEAVNQGQGTLLPPPPATRPDLFQWSLCHGHFHYQGFAIYELVDGAGDVVLTGRKQAYCMEDTAQFHEGPNVACDKLFTCDEQGIQAGWSDLYGNALDCQWLDVTDIAPGNYTLRVTLNPERAFEEVSFGNNVGEVPVTLP